MYCNFLKKVVKLQLDKEKCIEQDRSQEVTGLQRTADDETRQKVFCDITWEHPAEQKSLSKPGRSLHVTEEAV